MKITQSLFAVLLIAATALITSVPLQMAHAGTPEQNRAVGFSDACNHIPLSGHHTPSYLDGYNAGLAQCGPTHSAVIPVGPSSSSSSSSSGNSVTIINK